MRILSFTEKWQKLDDDVFTTFRYPRADKDWYVGEEVQVWFKQRSPLREKIGIAVIIGKERRALNEYHRGCVPLTTDKEAQDDGFENRIGMKLFMIKRYGLDYISLFNKLTLTWIKEEK